MPTFEMEFIRKKKEKDATSAPKVEQLNFRSRDTQKRDERLLDIDLLINEALKKNNEAVVDEHLKATDSSYVKRQIKARYAKEQSELNKRIKKQYGPDLEADPSRGYLFEQADISWRSGRFCQPSSKKDKLGENWNVFSDDSLYRAYKKRT